MTTRRPAPPYRMRLPLPHYRIRSLAPEHIAWLHRDCWPEMPLEAVHARLSRFLKPRSGARAMSAIVAVTRSGILGYGQIEHLRVDTAELSELFVVPQWRSRGIGRAVIYGLMLDGVAWPAAGLDWFELGVTAGNTRARALYERLGFVWAYDRDIDMGAGVETVHYLRRAVPDW